MRRAVASALAALALVCAAPASANRTVALDVSSAVHAFVVGTDGALYHAPPGGVLARLGGSGLAQEPVATARDATGELVVAARGEDGTVFVLPGGEWSARVQIATGAAGAPDLLSKQDGSLELFFRGIDGKLWWAAQTATGWDEPEALGEAPAGEPAAILDGNAMPTVFVREADGQLRVWQYDGAWASALAGGDLPGDPAVARHADRRLEIFARGQDGTPWFSHQPALSAFTFSPWAAQSALAIVGNPSLAVGGNSFLYAFARGTDGALWWAYQEPTNRAWSQWESLGGTLTGDPVAIRNRFGLIEVVAPSTGATWIARAQSAGFTWEPGFRPLGEAKPPADPPPVVLEAPPAPAPPVVPPTYAPRRLVVDLKADAKAGKTSTVFKGLTVRSVPAGATVTVTCEKGCKRKSLTFRNVMGTVSLKPLFARRAKQGTLKAGTKIRVVVSAPNSIAAVKTLTVRARRAPSVATRCLAPGATVETLCA